MAQTVAHLSLAEYDQREELIVARRKRTTSVAPPVAHRSSVVWAIFDPAGDIHVRAVAPSGNAYAIAPRTPFKIAAEDVDWFFHEWEAQHRQCLSREDEYQPRRAQFDNGRASRDARRATEQECPQSDSVVPPTPPEPEPYISLPEEPVMEPEENEPDPVMAGESDNEDKE